MNFESITTLIVTIAGVIPTVVSLVTLIVNIIKNKNWSAILTMIMSAMSSVEEYAKTHTDMSSSDKLDMCLKAVENSAASQGITLDTSSINKIIATINELCSWSKTVNADEASTAVEAK